MGKIGKRKNNSQQDITLQMVLDNGMTLNIFLNHLISEHCPEILLFCIEAHQFQQHVMQYLGTIGSQTFTQNAKIIANRLYEKYIGDGSNCQINISGEMRDNLEDSIGDLMQLLSNDYVDLNVLCTIFDESIDEMKSLMMISLVRFNDALKH